MPDRVREMLKGVGRNQREILLWLGAQQGATSVEELRDRWPAAETRRTPSLPELLAQFQTSPIFAGHTASEPTEYAPFLEDEYFLGPDNPPENEGWIQWQPEEVLGQKPSNSQSSSLSIALRSLVERGLVEILHKKGKGYRVSHARLTFEGEVASVLLRTRGG